MAYNKEIIETVKQLTKEGRGQSEICEQTGVSERTQRRWKKSGYLGEIGTTIPSAYSWPEITAPDLARVGFKPDKTHIILAALSVARQQGNNRLSRFLMNYIDTSKRWPNTNIPESWHAVIAGFPIIAEDIDAPSLDKLAELVGEVHPYLDKELRRAYHKRVRPLLIGILGEVQAFLQDAAFIGGFPLVVLTAPPTWKPWAQEREYHVEDSLVKGKWTFGIPEKVRDLPLEKTWAGVLFDIVSRLPDPDRQRGQLLGTMQLTSLLYLWCSTAPGDFVPPLPAIHRTAPEGLRGTIAGAYLEWKEQDQRSSNQEKRP